MRFSIKRWPILRRSGFTIREILVIVVVISVGLLSVLVVLTNGMTYVQKTRQKVLALNLAREWMEAIYQIRDTNRTRRAGVKDFCRLKTDPLVDEGSPRCLDDMRFTSGAYVLQRLVTSGQAYFALTGPLIWLDLTDGIQSGDLQFSLCQQSGYRDSCRWISSLTSEGKYFRQIEWQWLYLKDVAVTWWSLLICTWWMNPECGNARAKEFRFCSTVAYVGDSTGEVKLCWVITNFKWSESIRWVEIIR